MNAANGSVLDYAIVITGGIASGKSSALAVFQALGYDSIDADEISHCVLNKQAQKVSDLWGDEYILKNAKVDRVKLGRLVFNDSHQRQRLEELLHPLIREEIIAQAQILEKKTKYYFIDIPLFFESKHYAISKSVLIYCSHEAQKQRLMQRNQLSDAEAEQRIASQMNIERKKELASFIIDNNGSRQDLQTECLACIEKLKI